MFEGDTIEDEQLNELYFKRTGTGTAKVRLNAWVKKRASVHVDGEDA